MAFHANLYFYRIRTFSIKIRMKILTAFTKDYWTIPSEAFGNVLKSCGDHSVIYAFPAYNFLPNISCEVLEGTGNSNV